MFFNPLRLLVSGLITLAVFGFVGFKALDAFDQAGDALDEASASAADEGSLLRGNDLAAALKTLEQEAGSGKDVLQVTVYPTYLAAEVSTGSEDDAKGYKVERDGDVQPFGVSLTGPGKLADNVFPLADLDPEALDRVVAAATKKDPSLSLDDVTHAIAGIDAISGKPDWKVYFGGASFFTANLDGSDVRKGGSAPAAADDAVADATLISDCLAMAAGDVEAVQACTR